MSYSHLEWLEMAISGAGVKRFHTVPTIGSETIAEHCYGVAVLCFVLSEYKPNIALIKRALFHDSAEQCTGDCPAPAKWEHPALASSIDGIEKSFNERYHLDPWLTEEEQLIFKWADMLQLLIYCRAQRRLGNVNLEPVFERGVAYLTKLDVPNNIAQDILIHLTKTHGELS